MNKSLLIIIIAILGAGLVAGGIIISQKQSSSNTQETTIEQTGKETPTEKTEERTEQKANIPSYSGAVVDEDKCGKDAFYVEEKSADFVKNYCKFLRENGWKLVHQDYPDCEDIKSFGGGYNYEKGTEKLSISVIRYGENATCFWVYPK